jgi:hypothetical protein
MYTIDPAVMFDAAILRCDARIFVSRFIRIAGRTKGARSTASGSLDGRLRVSGRKREFA